MTKKHSPIILDSWLYLLSQLKTDHGTLGKNLWTIRQTHYQPGMFAFLTDAGLIRQSFGEHKGYRLCYPLKDIPFSLMVNLWSLSSYSYTRKLLLHYGHLSVDAVCQLPMPVKNSVPYSLNSVCHVIKTLRYGEFMSPRYFYPKAYCPDYGHLIGNALKKVNLATHQYGRGFMLTKLQRDITFGDIAPIVSNRSYTLGKILTLAKDVPVTKII